MGEEEVHPAVVRITADRENDLVDALATEISGADLTSLLLEVVKRRASARAPAAVLAQYERDRFVRPAAPDPLRLAELEFRALRRVGPPFAAVTTSPLVPLGTHSTVAGVHQHRVVTTTRGTEVAADPTNSLALEAAVRRRRLLATDGKSTDLVELASVDRVVRAQRFAGPLSFAHFSLLGLVSAGRDVGDFGFETDAIRRHVAALAAVCRDAGCPDIEVRLTDFSGRHGESIDRLVASIGSEHVAAGHWPERTAAHGYYPAVCFALQVIVDGERIEVGDGGFVDWTQSLVGSRKERLMISGLSLERLAMINPG